MLIVSQAFGEEQIELYTPASTAKSMENIVFHHPDNIWNVEVCERGIKIWIAKRFQAVQMNSYLSVRARGVEKVAIELHG